MNELQQYIRSLMPFSGEAWELLQPCLTEISVRKNDFLLKEGQVCTAVFFVSQGLCKSCHNLDGKEINTAFCFENEFATNTKSLTSGVPSTYAIKACERSRIVRMDKSALLHAYSLSHEVERFGRKVLELITTRQEEHADSFKLLTPRQRFDSLVNRHPDFLQRVSLTQVASYLGISRETLSRFRASR